jgi:hypothetical protein
MATYHGFSFVSDGSEFAQDLNDLVLSVIEPSKKEVVIPSIFVVVRGNSFRNSGDDVWVYDNVVGTLGSGGIVLATTFLSLEISFTEFSDVLPFDHVNRDFKENSPVRVSAPPGSAACSIIDPHLDIINTYEILTAKPGAAVALWQQKEIPLLGCSRVGGGLCIYFNACQHSCEADMESPLSAFPPFQEAVAASLRQMVAGHVRQS